jgi:hypothetical protein
MARELIVKKNDTTVWVFTVRDANGVQNLASATTVKIMMTPVGSTTLKINKIACSVIDAPNGRIQYNPVAGDVDTIGDFNTEVEIVWADGRISTWPSAGYLPTHIWADLG